MNAITATKSKLEWALYWARRMKVFPCGDNDKVARIKEWQKLASSDELTIMEWWDTWPNANIAAVPALSGHVVFDLDVKGEKDGIAELKKLEALHSELPDTLVIQTPSGGLHFWFKGCAPNSVDRIARGIDVRGESAGKFGYVLMPGSIIDGKAYEVAND